MKKVFLIAIIVVGTLTYLTLSTRADKPEKLMIISATKYVQLGEYADELNRSLYETDEKNKKFELGLSALLKVQQSLDSLHYLGAVLEQENISTSVLTNRLTVMNGNLRDYLLLLNKGQNLNSNQEKAIKKDIRDAQMIVKKLNYKWIEKSNFEKIKQAIPDINEFLTKGN